MPRTWSTFDDGTQGFKEVEGEAVAVLLVGVQDANTGVEPVSYRLAQPTAMSTKRE